MAYSRLKQIKVEDKKLFQYNSDVMNGRGRK